MKLKVNKEKCIGCGQCVSMTDQKVFDFDDDNLAKVVEAPVSNEKYYF
jgi:ferredoxin